MALYPNQSINQSYDVMWFYTVSPVAECSSPEPPHCLTRLCQQHTSTPPAPSQFTSSQTSTSNSTQPDTTSHEYAVPTSLQATTSEISESYAMLTTASETSSVLTLPCTSAGGIVTSVWGCPLRSTEITSPPNVPNGLYVVARNL